MRRRMVDATFEVWERLLHHRRGQDALLDATRPGGQAVSFPGDVLDEQPYEGLPPAPHESSGQRPVFVTARFRTGSTLLWQLFHELPDVRAYYEPFNHRRWFDPERRGSYVDPSHRGVDDYWGEYDDLSELGRLYEERWSQTGLFMDERTVAPRMEEYVRTLVDAAPGRAVLQFNRVDFRLDWLRAQFPDARIVHLYRHPRTQWRATLRGDRVPDDMTLERFEPMDRFYLTKWVDDLRWQVPVLRELEGEHPYVAFYLIWRLSYLFGRTRADLSLAYEDLIDDPIHWFDRVLETCELPPVEPEYVTQRVDRAQPYSQNSETDDRRFEIMERRAESWLRSAVGPGMH